MSGSLGGRGGCGREDEPGHGQHLSRSIVVGAVVAVAVVAAMVAVTWLLWGQDDRPHDDVTVSTGSTARLPEGVPASCPLTVPHGGFEPPDDYRQGPGTGGERLWYGDLDLWTALPRSGEVVEPNDDGRLGVRYFVWSIHQAPPRDEPDPDLTITATPVGQDGPVTGSHRATNGFVGTNTFMIAGLVLPEPGCWELTAEFRDHRLSWTIWAGPAEG